ncbi:MAG: hypothetical protein U0263_24205 [Polyangiaceae bacterium]
MRKAGSLALTLVIGLALSASCAKKREVTIELLDACSGNGTSFRDAADFVQFAVYPNACPSDDVLAAGDVRSANDTWTVSADSSLPEVGDLPQSKFGFAVMLRDKDCTVIGYGCTEADLESISGVKIAACDWSNHDDPKEPKCACQLLKGGGCFPPNECNTGQCKPPKVPDPGGCSLVIDKAGKLPPPISPTAVVSGPAVVGTDDGFVIGYRDQSAEKLRAVLTYLSDTGELAAPAVFDLEGCAEKEPLDGTGMAFEDGGGMFTASLPDCGKGAGAVFVPFASNGAVDQAAAPRNNAFKNLKMAQGGSIAAATATGEWELIYQVTTDATPRIERVVLQGPVLKQTIYSDFGADELAFGMVATSPQIRALLAPVPSASGTVVKVGPRNGDTFDEKGTFSLPQAAWAAMTAWKSRVAAGVPAGAGMTVSMAELGSGGVTVKATGLVGKGTVAGGAMAALRSHLFVAQGRSGGITVHRLDGADASLNTKPVVEMDFPVSLGPTNLSSFDGTRIAIAAARERVVVTWVSKGKLASGDATGGWALLRCTD